MPAGYAEDMPVLGGRFGGNGTFQAMAVRNRRAAGQAAERKGYGKNIGGAGAEKDL